MKIVSISDAVALLKDGGIVGIPTETVYGLAADGLNEQAVRAVFEAKGRPVDNPLILHVNSRRMLDKLVRGVSAQSEILMEKFWPGPLTLVFDKSDLVPDIVTAGLDTVCIRMPRQHLTLDLIKRLKSPLAAPSANRSGRPSTTDVVMFRREMPDVPVMDGGVTEIGVESTVVDARTDQCFLLRQGGVSVKSIEEIVNKKLIRSEEIRSPGQLHRHYSPSGKIILFDSSKSTDELLKEFVENKVSEWGVICDSSKINDYRNASILDIGRNSKEHAKNLFHLLHKTEDLGWKRVLVDLDGIDTGEGIADTVIERLRRAAE
jgi:L-threonylcarbamoyladenylate synthase